MKKHFKFIGIFLSVSLFITPISEIIYQNNVAQSAEEYMYSQEFLEVQILENVEKENKNSTEKIKYENNQITIENRSLTTIATVATIIGTALAIDIGYMRAERLKWNKVKETYNGWVSLTFDSGKTIWFYKENGNYKKGWHWDTQYNSWYYLYDVTFVVGDPTFSKVRYNTSLMYDPNYNSKWLKLNNKWYEFQLGGKLIQHEGWFSYNGKWLYFLPGDYGALANQGRNIDGKWYNFDSNGYWV